jgi:hypothetical protein
LNSVTKHEPIIRIEEEYVFIKIPITDEKDIELYHNESVDDYRSRDKTCKLPVYWNEESEDRKIMLRKGYISGEYKGYWKKTGKIIIHRQWFGEVLYYNKEECWWKLLTKEEYDN